MRLVQLADEIIIAAEFPEVADSRRRLRITRERLADTSISRIRVARELDRVPGKTINGTELTSNAILRWVDEHSPVLRRIYSGDLLFQLTFKRGFRDGNPRREGRWFALRRGFDRFPNRLFRDACLASIYEKTNGGNW